MKTFSLSLLILSALTACVDSSLPADSEPVEIHISYSQNLSARFNAKFSNSTPDSISWKFGDGYQGIGNSISHKYLSPGNYTGTLSYVDNDQEVKKEFSVNLDGHNQNVTIKPKVNVIIDSDHNDPNQDYSDNNQTPQSITSPMMLTGIMLKAGSCQAGRLCELGDTLDWYALALNSGDNIEIELIKGSIDVLLQSADGNTVYMANNMSSQVAIPAGDLSNGLFQLKIKLNSQSTRAQYIVRAQQHTITESRNYQPGKLIVQWNNDHHAELVDISDPRLTAENNLENAHSLPEARDILTAYAHIKSVSLNYYRHAFSDNIINDIWQWPLTDQNISALWQPLLLTGHLPGENTTVAVLDTGLYAQHSNLIGMNTHSGYDFVSDPINSGDNDGWDADPSDPGDNTLSYHGSHVTGIIAAQPSDAPSSITGIAWATQIMPLRVLGKSGGTSYDLIQALRYAAGLENETGRLPSTPADIINLSLGGAEFSVAEQATINEVINTGAIVIAASGNQGQNTINYPAGYKNVLAVGATDHNGDVASYSNYGPFIDLVAPGGICSNSQCTTGVNSLSAMGKIQNGFDSRQSSWKRMSGTSMATAHVSGLLAIVRSQLPALDSEQLNTLITQGHLTTDLNENGFDTLSGWGALNSDQLTELINSSQLDQPSIWTNKAELFAEPNTRFEQAVISRGELGNKNIHFNYDSGALSVTLNQDKLIINTQSSFADHQTVDILLDGKFMTRINIYPVNNYELPEYSQHLYLNFENNGLQSSGLRTFIDQNAWQANVPPLTPGQVIQASSDIDYDGVYCELGEFCAYSEYSSNSDENKVILNGSILGR